MGSLPRLCRARRRKLAMISHTSTTAAGALTAFSDAGTTVPIELHPLESGIFHSFALTIASFATRMILIISLVWLDVCIRPRPYSHLHAIRKALMMKQWVDYHLSLKMPGFPRWSTRPIRNPVSDVPSKRPYDVLVVPEFISHLKLCPRLQR